MAAARRLEQFVGGSPRAVRLTATLLWLAFLLFSFGYLMGLSWNNWSSATRPRELVVTMLGAALACLCIVAPLFATGDLEICRGESALPVLCCCRALWR